MGLFCDCSHSNKETLFYLREIFRVMVITERRITKKMAKLSEQVEELRGLHVQLKDTITDEAAELRTKLEALEAKIVELGEADPDLQDMIDEMHASIASVEALVTEEGEPMEPTVPEPTPEPVPEPTEPTSLEPTPAPVEENNTGGDAEEPGF